MLHAKCLVVLMLFIVGCSQTPAPVPKEETPSTEGAKFLLSSEPAGAKGVIEVRKQADGETVTVVGRIGGKKKPFVTAGFFLVDPLLKPCDDDCGWDYCEESSRIPQSRLLVR